MDTKDQVRLFKDIERRAKNLSLNGRKHPFKWHQDISGLLSPKAVELTRQSLKELTVDDYVAKVLDPAESTSRPSARAAVSKLRGKIHSEFELGPLYSVEISLEHNGATRRLAFIAQDRSISNGVWKPEHHLEACRLVDEYAGRAVPIVTFMDTPGADAGTEANEANQAHSISRLIAVMAAAKVPSIGVIYGLGYSGGAIPLATTNLLLAVRCGAFNTIQPKGLANIARQYNLSWQESARYVGVSPSELYRSGAIDGVIDWDPSDSDDAITDNDNLVAAIFTGIQEIEADAKREVLENPKVAADYVSNVRSEKLHKHSFDTLQKAANFQLYKELSEYPSVYSHAVMYLRSLSMRCRIHSTTIEAYGRLAEEEIPKGDLHTRTQQLREVAIQQWLSDPEKLVYNDQLAKAWSTLKQRRDELDTERNKLTAFILGDPQSNYVSAQKNFCFVLCLYLYNRWKSDAAFNFVEMSRQLSALPLAEEGVESALDKDQADLTLLDTLFEPAIRDTLQDQFRNVLVFDALYNNIVTNFGEIAEESKAFQSISEKTLRGILDTSLEKVASSISVTIADGVVNSDTKAEFAKWLSHFVKYDQRGAFLADVEEWKRVNFPRMSDSLLVLITYFFETLVPRFIESQMSGKSYNGQINPGRIGKRKDFWNQLNIAYRDLMIQRVLTSYKRQKLATVDAFKAELFSEFDETNANRMTANPVSFPGFRQSIEKSLNNGVTPCGVVTGIGKLKLDESGETAKVGALISNVAFQAGAFDMAGAEKLCSLLIDSADLGLPVVCFVSSGGMQTKEGPCSLFSMAIVNDRITAFIAETGLPVIIFGFGDCTGGSQASFVTHPLVHTYYFSGTDIPFAGRVVVPSFLPSVATTSNYLANNPGTMQGLVKHPFAEGLDEKLLAVDPTITLPTQSIGDVVSKVISGAVGVDNVEQAPTVFRAVDQMGKIETVLIHARGCTAIKLIRVAQEQGHKVMLVQSDPDMDSAACDMLTERDEVVCLGGQTPGESYLNGLSVVTIAKNRGADALHPGIGFLSENAGFARLCRANGLNFIGPKASSMDTMGNKSNAIHTAMANNVPVVPGSHGILTSAEATAKVADEIGYPVLLKAVHGGGG
ncbi:MAG: hypothetical protein JKX81_03070, partial [Arenicella sp.]|nr:hypothetical protein [Arenicella sp.]